MFDFEKLTVYKKSILFNKEVFLLLKNRKVHSVYKNQLVRASSSIILNIAEGSGRFTKPDRRNFYVIARGSIFECVALLEILKSEGAINEQDHSMLYDSLDQLSRILFTMIHNLK